MCRFCETSIIDLARGYENYGERTNFLAEPPEIRHFIGIGIVKLDNFYLCAGDTRKEYCNARVKINYCPMCGRKLGE